MQTQNQEDYLRAVYNLYEKNKENITSIKVAEFLDISKPAVSKMVKKLVEQKLIKMEPYSNMVFTTKGLRIAKKLTYKRRVVEVFLVDILKIKKNKMHEEAHKLEHAFSDNTIKKLDNYLNNPKICPDGKDISRLIK